MAIHWVLAGVKVDSGYVHVPVSLDGNVNGAFGGEAFSEAVLGQVIKPH